MGGFTSLDALKPPSPDSPSFPRPKKKTKNQIFSDRQEGYGNGMIDLVVDGPTEVTRIWHGLPKCELIWAERALNQQLNRPRPLTFGVYSMSTIETTIETISVFNSAYSSTTETVNVQTAVNVTTEATTAETTAAAVTEAVAVVVLT